MKLISATDKNFRYQYQLCDAAVEWANINKHELLAIANQREGKNRSYYLLKSAGLVTELEQHWNCNSTRALYTAIVNYLRYREETS